MIGYTDKQGREAIMKAAPAALKATVRKHEKREFFRAESSTKLHKHLRNRATLLAKDGNEITRVVVKIGRNKPCPCGSGIKFKKCCIGLVQPIDGLHPRGEVA